MRATTARSAAVEATAARTTIVESAIGPAAESAAVKSASSAVTIAPTDEATPIITGPAVVIRPSVVGPPIETRSPIIAAVPRPGTDKNSADEPVRTVVAVGGAGIRGIIVIAIGTYRGAVTISANPNGNPNLRLRRSRQRKHANRQQNEVFEITHFLCPREVPG